MVRAAYHCWRCGSHQATSIAQVHQSLQALSKLAGGLTAPLQGIIRPGAVAGVLCNVEALLLHEGLADLATTARVCPNAAMRQCGIQI